jgi:Bacterial Ig-like domain (group 2)
MNRVRRNRIWPIALLACCMLGGCKSGGGYNAGGNNGGGGPSSPSLQSIQVSPANSSAPLGRTQQFTATGMLSNGSTEDLTTTVTWSSSAPAVATISGAGLANSKNQGSTTILATSGSVSGSTGWNVVAPALVSIAVSPANASIPRGTTQQFSAMGTFTDGTMQDVTGSVGWISSPPSVVSINSAGLAAELPGAKPSPSRSGLCGRMTLLTPQI